MANRLTLPSASKGDQLRNRAFWNDSRSPGEADFFTFGYSGRPTNEILDALNQANVSTVVDIRFTPISMYKPDFSKRNLQRIVESQGLSYLHLPSLGVPRDVRARAAEEGNLDLIWEWYDAEVVPRFIGHNLHGLLNMAEHPLAFMCVEIDPRACHRHRLFQALEDRGLYGCEL